VRDNGAQRDAVAHVQMPVVGANDGQLGGHGAIVPSPLRARAIAQGDG
jgi:hypothetical protein